jgi:hypothetical protein
MICRECNQPKISEDDYDEGQRWCNDCMDAERARHLREDVIEGADPAGVLPGLARLGPIPPGVKVFSRPPKYAVNPEDYERFNY